MAKAAVKGRKARRGTAAEEPGAASRLVSEAAGIFLLGSAALAGLALATYEPGDSPFPLPLGREVVNQAGPIGASLAYGLLWLMGFGATIFVAAAAFLGGSLVLGQGVPPIQSRFWVGSGLLIVSVACLQPLLGDLISSEFAGPPGGLLGSHLVGYEVLLLGRWGALLVNSLILLVGLLSVTGISTGSALAAVGSGAKTLGGWMARVLVGAWALSQSAVVATLEALRSGFDGLRRAWASLVVWQEQRARRSRVAEMRAPDVAVTPNASSPVKAAGARLAGPEPRAKGRGGERPANRRPRGGARAGP